MIIEKPERPRSFTLETPSWRWKHLDPIRKNSLIVSVLSSVAPPDVLLRCLLLHTLLCHPPRRMCPSQRLSVQPWELKAEAWSAADCRTWVWECLTCHSQSRSRTGCVCAWKRETACKPLIWLFTQLCFGLPSYMRLDVCSIRRNLWDFLNHAGSLETICAVFHAQRDLQTCKCPGKNKLLPCIIAFLNWARWTQTSAFICFVIVNVWDRSFYAAHSESLQPLLTRPDIKQSLGVNLSFHSHDSLDQIKYWFKCHAVQMRATDRLFTSNLLS